MSERPEDKFFLAMATLGIDADYIARMVDRRRAAFGVQPAITLPDKQNEPQAAPGRSTGHPVT